jgi:hypothetical protein
MITSGKSEEDVKDAIVVFRLGEQKKNQELQIRIVSAIRKMYLLPMT